MHGEADVSGTVQTHHVLLLGESGASDEVLSSDHVGFVVHVASMDQNGKESKGPGPVPRLSHPVQEVCHRFLVLFIGCEPIREASGNLTGCRLDRREIPTLGQDVGLVGVGSGFVHTDILVTGVDGSWVQVDSPPTVTDPSLLE